MKRIRFGSALLLVALTLGFGLASGSKSSAVESAPQCTCAYPNTGEYGVKENNDCKVTTCWVSIDAQ